MVKSATMKRLWADPEWKLRQLAACEEGLSRAASDGRPRGRKRTGVKRGRNMQLTVVFDPEVFATLDALATKQAKPMAELIRTYVDWGLEQEQLCQD